MASLINTTNIDTAYPVAGQDNDSQGFRDNFTNIRSNLDTAKLEIEELQPEVKGDLLTYSTTGIDKLPVGITNGLVLTVDSTEATGLRWVAIPASAALETTTGEVDVSAAAAPTTGQVLTATTGTTATWQTPAAGGASFSGALVVSQFSQTIPDSISTILTWSAEIRDTDSYHSTVTNTSRLTIPVGTTKVKLKARIVFDGNATGYRYAAVRLNGAAFPGVAEIYQEQGGIPIANSLSLLLQTAVVDVTPTDYFEIEVFQNSGGNLSVENQTTGSFSWFELEKVE